VFLDAGLFIGAIATPDSRHAEAFPRVEDARLGLRIACTTTGILSEVYAALTWHKSTLPLTPQQAALAIRALIEPPSGIRVLPDGFSASLKTLELAENHCLTARRVHDTRHAATALVNGIFHVYTYDPGDWTAFENDGLSIAGLPSTLARVRTP
jgi:predicted nucleic acid-binding protein